MESFLIKFSFTRALCCPGHSLLPQPGNSTLVLIWTKYVVLHCVVFAKLNLGMLICHSHLNYLLMITLPLLWNMFWSQSMMTVYLLTVFSIWIYKQCTCHQHHGRLVWSNSVHCLQLLKIITVFSNVWAVIAKHTKYLERNLLEIKYSHELQ